MLIGSYVIKDAFPRNINKKAEWLSKSHFLVSFCQDQLRKVSRNMMNQCMPVVLPSSLHKLLIFFSQCLWRWKTFTQSLFQRKRNENTKNKSLTLWKKMNFTAVRWSKQNVKLLDQSHPNEVFFRNCLRPLSRLATFEGKVTEHNHQSAITTKSETFGCFSSRHHRVETFFSNSLANECPRSWKNAMRILDVWFLKEILAAWTIAEIISSSRQTNYQFDRSGFGRGSVFGDAAKVLVVAQNELGSRRKNLHACHLKAIKGGFRFVYALLGS